jgi:hypothetical protein
VGSNTEEERRNNSGRDEGSQEKIGAGKRLKNEVGKSRLSERKRYQWDMRKTRKKKSKKEGKRWKVER